MDVWIGWILCHGKHPVYYDYSQTKHSLFIESRLKKLSESPHPFAQKRSREANTNLLCPPTSEMCWLSKFLSTWLFIPLSEMLYCVNLSQTSAQRWRPFAWRLNHHHLPTAPLFSPSLAPWSLSCPSTSPPVTHASTLSSSYFFLLSLSIFFYLCFMLECPPPSPSPPPPPLVQNIPAFVFAVHECSDRSSGVERD